MRSFFRRIIFHRVFSNPVWRNISKDPFGIWRLAEVEVEIRAMKRRQLVVELKAEVLREIQEGK